MLLTLLCLVFGEAGNFPVNRSELYKEGLDVLLKKWDAKRNIERDQVYKNLSLQRKEDLLSQIALTTFEQKNYFFKQKTVEADIADFIRNLRDAHTEPKELELDSEAVLRSIEGQHGLLVERAKGIYSFSHLTFQEYFAAREIVANSAWEKLVEHITETRWRQVFLLTVGMMRKADDLMLLMKRKIDVLLADDENMQQFLMWISQKSLSVEISDKTAVARAFYFDLEYATTATTLTTNQVVRNQVVVLTLIFNPNRDYTEIARVFHLAFALDNNRATTLDLELDINLARTLMLATTYDFHDDVNYDVNYSLACALKYTSETNLELQKLKEQLPDQCGDKQTYKTWWKTHGKTWTQQLRSTIVKCRNIGHDWQFSNVQQQLLQQYYDANKLLVDCLNSDCYISREVRQEIEETLLLPMSEIEKRQK
ncbi:MAG: NACHT domain-containing protein [Brasilonema sp.]